MSRSWNLAALCSLALVGAGGPTGASAVEPGELATPGVCASESRELRKGPITSKASEAGGGDASRSTAGSASPGSATIGGSQTAGSTATGSPRVHLTPIQVAASPVPFSGPRPALQTFAGPGACDQPGSGCQGPVLRAPSRPVFVDPTPAGGCDFPGCER